ncbi:MAG TPA: LytTR family DNA-binding domain-containing protein, partial [Cytophagaceae bacterium]
TGFDFLETINPSPKVVFTTAYSEYAIESFRFDVVSYLLKPISIEKFTDAIEKIKRIFNVAYNPEAEINFPDFPEKLRPIDIKLIEASGNYVKVYTEKKHFLVHCTMKKMASVLSQYGFQQVHKSFICNLHNIHKIVGDVCLLKVPEKRIPIGRAYKNNLVNKVKNLLL